MSILLNGFDGVKYPILEDILQIIKKLDVGIFPAIGSVVDIEYCFKYSMNDPTLVRHCFYTSVMECVEYYVEDTILIRISLVDLSSIFSYCYSNIEIEIIKNYLKILERKSKIESLKLN